MWGLLRLSVGSPWLIRSAPWLRVLSGPSSYIMHGTELHPKTELWPSETEYRVLVPKCQLVTSRGTNLQIFSENITPTQWCTTMLGLNSLVVSPYIGTKPTSKPNNIHPMCLVIFQSLTDTKSLQNSYLKYHGFRLHNLTTWQNI